MGKTRHRKHNPPHPGSVKRRRERERSCPTPTKQPFNNAGAAADALRAWPRLSRSYRCACGKWHLTSRSDFPATPNTTTMSTGEDHP